MDINKLTLVLNNFVNNIKQLKKEDVSKIDTSIKVNTIIRNFKFDKNIKEKLKNGDKIDFTPLLSPKSRFISNILGIDIFLILKSITDDSRIIELCLNELFNIINYKKSTVRFLSDGDFQYLKNMFIDIFRIYKDAFLLTDDFIYNSNNIKYKAIGNTIIVGVNYKIVFIKPTEKYGKIKFKNHALRLLGLPTLINKDGIPNNPMIWNTVYNANKRYGLSLLVKCLVPYNVIVQNGKAYDVGILKKDALKYYNKNISNMTHNYDRYSIILNSTLATVMNKQKTLFNI